MWGIFVPKGQQITTLQATLQAAAGKAISKITRQIIARKCGSKWRRLARSVMQRASQRIWKAHQAEMAEQKAAAAAVAAVAAAEQAAFIARMEVEMLDVSDHEADDITSLRQPTAAMWADSGQLHVLGVSKQVQALQGRNQQQQHRLAQQPQQQGSVSAAHRELAWLSLGGLDGGYWRQRDSIMVEG